MLLPIGQNADALNFGNVQVSTMTMNFNYLLTLAQHYGHQGTIADGDLTGDGSVAFDDLLLLAQNYGHTLPAPVAAAVSLAPTDSSDPAPWKRRKNGVPLH